MDAAPLSVPPNARKGTLHLVQRGGPGVSPFAQFAEALTPLPGASGSDKALLSRLGLSSCSFHPPSGPCFGSPRIDPPPSVRPARRESIGAEGLVPAGSQSSVAPAAPQGGAPGLTAGGMRPRLSSAGHGPQASADAASAETSDAGGAGYSATDGGATATGGEGPGASPHAGALKSPHGSNLAHDRVNPRLSGGKRSASRAAAGMSGGSRAATVGSAGGAAALCDVASLAGDAPGGSAASIFDSEAKRNKTASRRLNLPSSKLSIQSSASGASTLPSLPSVPSTMDPPTAPQHRVPGGVNVPQSAMIAGFGHALNIDSTERPGLGGSGGSASGSGAPPGNPFIHHFAEGFEGGGMNLDPALMSQMLCEEVEDAAGSGDGPSDLFALRSNLPMGADDDMGGDAGSGANAPSSQRLKPSKSRQGRPKKCSCTKSKCLKLYCDCFSVGQLCDGCNCNECGNTEANIEEIEKARKSVLKRSKNAFAAKFVEADGNAVIETKGKDSKHARGCNCSKSRCIKNYCECWQMGIQCSEKCKCVNCSNGKPDSETPDEHGEAAAPPTDARIIQNLAASLDVVVPNGPEDLTGDLYLDAPPDIPMPSRMPSLPPEMTLAHSSTGASSNGFGQGGAEPGSASSELVLSDLLASASDPPPAHRAGPAAAPPTAGGAAGGEMQECDDLAAYETLADDDDDTGVGGGRPSLPGERGATEGATFAQVAAALGCDAPKADGGKWTLGDEATGGSSPAESATAMDLADAKSAAQAFMPTGMEIDAA